MITKNCICGHSKSSHRITTVHKNYKYVKTVALNCRVCKCKKYKMAKGVLKRWKRNNALDKPKDPTETEIKATEDKKQERDNHDLIDTILRDKGDLELKQQNINHQLLVIRAELKEIWEQKAKALWEEGRRTKYKIEQLSFKASYYAKYNFSKSDAKKYEQGMQLKFLEE